MPKNNTFIFILAGGRGTRFWPLSRANRPKQFLKIFGRKSMLQLTYKRCLSLAGSRNIYIVTSQGQEAEINRQLTGIKKTNILIEPLARGTAAAVALSAAKAIHLNKNSVMAVIPADQYIFREIKFIKDIKKALSEARRSACLVTVGIKPAFAATGYGYLKLSESKNSKKRPAVYKVDKFIEKPTISKAKRYVKSPAYYHNSGMFIWQTQVFLDELKKFMPRHYKAALNYVKAYNCRAKKNAADNFYKKLAATSIDYGLMQKSSKISGIKAGFGWSDLGSLKSFEEIDLKPLNTNISIGALHLSSETNNCIIYGQADKLIATLGIEDTVVIQTDNAVLIAKKNKIQNVRRMVMKMSKDKKMKRFI